MHRLDKIITHQDHQCEAKITEKGRDPHHHIPAQHAGKVPEIQPYSKLLPFPQKENEKSCHPDQSPCQGCKSRSGDVHFENLYIQYVADQVYDHGGKCGNGNKPGIPYGFNEYGHSIEQKQQKGTCHHDEQVSVRIVV